MMDAFREELAPLGNTDIHIPPMGIGTWAWGERLFWGFGQDYQEEDVKGAFEESLQSGTNFFDTAELYGRGKSEELLGKFIKTVDQPVIIATKFMPFPWRLWKGRLVAALQRSLKRLGLANVDLYQIHHPLAPVSIETWAEGLVEAVAKGLTRAVGVSNYNRKQMEQTQSVLQKHDVPLASNQVEYSLIHRKVEFNGLLEACKKAKITLIAYSPLAQGVLTGKYTPEKPPSGVRGLRYRRGFLEKVQPLVQRMEAIGRDHRGKSPAQVALNWTICKGAVPIPGAKNAEQARENIAALGWRLTEDEVIELDFASEEIQT